MTEKNQAGEDAPRSVLRQRAEGMLQTSRTDIARMSTEDVQALVHELQVHQMELEIQNEELRQAQIELAESRDRFSDLYELAPVGYITLRRDGRVLRANLGATAMLDVERQSLIGAKFSDFVTPEGQDQWHLHRQAVFADTKQQTCELPLWNSKTGDCWTRLESTSCRDEQGGISECRIVMVDITQRKQVELALEQLNQSLEEQVAERTATQVMLKDVASMANLAMDADSAIEDAVQCVGQRYGWNFGRAWLPSKTDPDKLIPGCAWCSESLQRLAWTREQIERPIAHHSQGIIGRAFASGKPQFTADIADFVSIERAEAGTSSVGAFPILANNQPVGVLEFFSEDGIESSEQLLSVMESVGLLLGRVIEREQAACRLRASEERHRAVLNAAGDGIVLLDREAMILDVNPATERIFHYSADELVGSNCSLLLPVLHREQSPESAIESLQNCGISFIGKGHEVSAQRKNGNVFPIEVQISQIQDEDLLVVVIRDISERKALERQVVNAAADEQRRIGQDIHDGVGQELSGLRYMAQTHAEILSQQASPETKTAERMTHWLETIQRQMRAIIRELIPVELDQQGLAAALQELAERMTQAHDLVCTFDCERPIVVEDTALATHLYRIVQEAAGNAARHAQAAHVVIRMMEDSSMLKVQVTDDGVGIGSAVGNSAGIGLRTMAYRVGLIGGRLSVDNREQKGTTVSCVVPK